MFGLPLIVVEVGGFVLALVVICGAAFVYGYITRDRA
jgi:hypothetical protein